MKSHLFLLFLALMVSEAQSQIIITGFMSDPAGTDANYEYIQLMATEDINFSSHSYAVVICRNNPGSTLPANGWATGGTRTFKFNLASGFAAKGTFFYVGGSEKRIAGYRDEDGKSTDISQTADITENRANWIRAISTYDGTTNAIGDGFGQSVNNWLFQSANQITGIAVFDGTTVTNTTVPIDAIFYGDPAYQSNSSPPFGNLFNQSTSKGYLIPDNDYYKTSDNSQAQPYFMQGSNTFMFGMQPLSDISNFAKLKGIYHAESKTWTVPRSLTYITLLCTDTPVDSPQLSDIETGDITTLPVILTSFTVKRETNFIRLNWQTASEQNNHHFDILRSANGTDFKRIGTKAGKGTTSNSTRYTYDDIYPYTGINYNKIRQNDFDGHAAESATIAVHTLSKSSSISLSAIAEGNLFILNIYTEQGGNGNIRITDANGRKLTEQKTNLEKGTTSIRIPADLPNGLYIATLYTETEQVSTKIIL